MFRRGFTLLEVLVAGGVLFIVSSAVVGLSNSIIQGTGLNSDRTEANRWASEGLELVNKIRIDTVKDPTPRASGEKIWFAPATDWQSTYGWYELNEDTVNNTWSLDPLTNLSNRVHLERSLVPGLVSDSLHNQGVTGYRLICVEAYGADSSLAGDDYIDCNRTPGSNPPTRKNDGNRNNVAACQEGIDTYCEATRTSINQNQLNATEMIIPPGNVVKVRSVIVWQDRNIFRTAEIGTVMTNWRGQEL